MFKKRVATAHAHAAYDPEYQNDYFSPDDTGNAAKRGVPNYVVTPLGTLRRYTPSTGEDSLLYTSMPSDPNHP